MLMRLHRPQLDRLEYLLSLQSATNRIIEYEEMIEGGLSDIRLELGLKSA